MSKILIMNEKESFDLIHDLNIKNGFDRYSMENINNIYFCTYQKLNVKNCNFVKRQNGFIACSGTLLYKGLIGEDALNKLYDNFRFNHESIRSDCEGFYCICVYQNDKFTIFTDRDGQYSLYYYKCESEGVILISTLYYYIQKVKHCDFNNYGLQERCVHFCNVDRETSFENIYRLRGNKKIVICNGTMTVKIIDRAIYSNSSVEISSGHEAVSAALRKYGKSLSTNFKKTALFSTGGFDSRLALAVMLNSGMKPTLLSWVGELSTANSDVFDREVSLLLSKKYDLPIKEIAFSNDYEKIENGLLEDSIHRFGELSKVYSSNTVFYQALKNIGDAYVTMGCLGECYRENDQIDKVYKIPFNITDYVNDFYLSNGEKKVLKELEKMSQYLIENISNCARTLGVNTNNLSVEDCMKIHYYFYRIHADTYMCQLLNMYTYSTNILCPRVAIDTILKTPYSVKRNTKMEIQCSLDLCPDIYDVRICSHHFWFDINTKDYSAKRMESKSVKIKHLIRTVVGDNFYEYIKRILHKDYTIKNHFTLEELNYYENCIEKFESSLGKKMEYDYNNMSYGCRLNIAATYYYMLALQIY